MARNKNNYENKKYFYPHVGYPRILVAPNQEVKAGDVLCILDRLGIEEKILAVEDGVIQDINLGPVGTLANCNDYILTLKHLVTEDELNKRREEKEYQFITAPWEASYWITEHAGSVPLVEMGDYVKKDQLIGIAMIAKQTREIKSELEGTVSAIYFSQGDVRKQGDRLFGLKKGD